MVPCLMRSSPPRPIPHCTVTRARLRSQPAGRWPAPCSTRGETTPQTREREAPPRPVRARRDRGQVLQEYRSSVPGIAVKYVGIRRHRTGAHLDGWMGRRIAHLKRARCSASPGLVRLHRRCRSPAAPFARLGARRRFLGHQAPIPVFDSDPRSANSSAAAPLRTPQHRDPVGVGARVKRDRDHPEIPADVLGPCVWRSGAAAAEGGVSEGRTLDEEKYPVPSTESR